MPAPDSQNWLTPDSLAGFGGAALALTLLTNILRRFVFTGRLERWAPAVTFALAIVITFAFHAETTAGLRGGLVQIVNAVLLFNTASGINHMVAAGANTRTRARGAKGGVKEEARDAGGGPPGGDSSGGAVSRFFSSWWG